jgi:hypothetical protein
MEQSINSLLVIGGVQVLVGHPLDTLKVRLQAQNPKACVPTFPFLIQAYD